MFHPKLVTGRVGIYARYSSDLQSENSIEDQARRARDEIARAGGDPSKAVGFPDVRASPRCCPRSPRSGSTSS